MDTDAFIRDGFTVVRAAFGQDTARACREMVWDVLAERGIPPGTAPPGRRPWSGFIVHTATWPHRGSLARMVAQPAVAVPAGFALDGSDPSPVARAIVQGLAAAH